MRVGIGLWLSLGVFFLGTNLAAAARAEELERENNFHLLSKNSQPQWVKAEFLGNLIYSNEEVELSSEEVAILFDVLKSSNDDSYGTDSHLKVLTLQVLARLRKLTNDQIRSLEDLIESSDLEVRTQAIATIADTSAELSEPLLDRFLSFAEKGDQAVRQKVAAALTSIEIRSTKQKGSPIGSLYLSDSTTPKERKVLSLRYLAVLHPPDQVEWVIKSVYDPDTEIQAYALKTLSNYSEKDLETPEKIREVLRAAKASLESPSVQVRNAAFILLGQIISYDSLAWKPGIRDSLVSLDHILDSDRVAVTAAVRILGADREGLRASHEFQTPLENLFQGKKIYSIETSFQRHFLLELASADLAQKLELKLIEKLDFQQHQNENSDLASELESDLALIGKKPTREYFMRVFSENLKMKVSPKALLVSKIMDWSISSPKVFAPILDELSSFYVQDLIEAPENRTTPAFKEIYELPHSEILQVQLTAKMKAYMFGSKKSLTTKFGIFQSYVNAEKMMFRLFNRKDALPVFTHLFPLLKIANPDLYALGICSFDKSCYAWASSNEAIFPDIATELSFQSTLLFPPGSSVRSRPLVENYLEQLREVVAKNPSGNFSEKWPELSLASKTILKGLVVFASDNADYEKRRLGYLAEEVLLNRVSDEVADQVFDLLDLEVARRKPLDANAARALADKLFDCRLHRARLSKNTALYFARLIDPENEKAADDQNFHRKHEILLQVDAWGANSNLDLLLASLAKPSRNSTSEPERLQTLSKVMNAITSHRSIESLPKEFFMSYLESLSSSKFDASSARSLLTLIPSKKDSKFIPTDTETDVMAKIMVYFSNHTSEVTSDPDMASFWKEHIPIVAYNYPVAKVGYPTLMLLNALVREHPEWLPALSKDRDDLNKL